MPAILPGYEYDIFISYRQNDNKYDGWVTDFVDNLKRELEATIKEPVNVYFDENPNDGLRESHNVDDSLTQKLKCILLIPIVSQTYCDPNAFAWEHEFLPFLANTSSDTLGMKVQLPNGNVATRILSIQIHEIDPQDKDLIEEKLKGPLRAIEFIYKEQGVNRPLKPDDNETKNLNSTKYRNQLNKVANSVKEIFGALTHSVPAAEPHLPTNSASAPSTTATLETPVSKTSSSKLNWVIGMGGLIILIFIGYMLASQFRSNDVIPEGEKSIVVLPFTNLSEDSEYNQICNGLSDDISDKLSKLKNLKVISRKSAYTYQNTRKSLTTIRDELDVRYIIDGSIQASGNDLRISVRLNDAIEDKVIWSNSYNRKMEDIFAVQNEVSLSVIQSLKINLDDSEVKSLETTDNFDLEAYEIYKVGLRNFYEGEIYGTTATTVPFFKKAIEKDPNLYPAYVTLARSHLISNGWGQVARDDYAPLIEELLTKAKNINPNYPPLWSTYAEFAINMLFDEKAYHEYLSKAIELDPNNPEIYFIESYYHDFKNEKEESNKAIQKGIELDPKNVAFYLSFKAFHQYFQRNYKEALETTAEVLELDPSHDNALWMRSIILTQLGRYEEAIGTFGKRSRAAKTNWALANAQVGLGNRDMALNILNYQLDKAKIEYVPKAAIGHIYLALGNKDEACRYFKEYLEAKDGGLIWISFLKNDPRMDALKGHPCYEEIMGMMPF